MPSSIVLRAAGPADADFLLSVYSATRAEELAVTDWTAEQKEQFCRMQFQAQDTHYRLHYPGARFDVILHGETRVGRLYVDRWPAEIRIMDIALLPEHRSHGIGSHLLQQLQAEAAAARKTLSIHVESFNRAMGLYERLGFRLKEDKGVYMLLEWSAAAPPVT